MILLNKLNYSKNIINLKNLSKLILISYLFISFLIYKDYGVSWDEMFQRSGGAVNAKYIYDNFISNIFSFFFNNASVKLENINSLDNWINEKNLQAYYGVAFDLPAVLIEFFFLGITDDTEKIYQLRHFLTFLVYFLGVLALKNNVTRIFSSELLGLLSLIFIILSPRFFAEAFYNSKDIVLMSIFSLGMLTLTKFINKPSIKNILLLSLITALAVNIRILGIFFFPLVTLSLFYKIRKVREFILLLLLYFLVALFLIILFFPYLWKNPIINFIEALKVMSNFPVAQDATTLFFGQYISLKNLPWNYLPSWIVITTPPLVIILFFFGIVSVLLNFRINFSFNYDKKYFLLLLNCIVVIAPILTVIFLNSPIYNGWRHLYFIYPSILIISLYGLSIIYKYINLITFKNFFSVIFFTTYVLHQINWIIKAHPIQNVYFNFMVGNDWKNKFDLDYWGLGNDIVLKNILSEDKRNLISVCPMSTMSLNMRSLRKIDQNRIKISCLGRPDYLINNYYEFWRIDRIIDNEYKIIHELRVFNEVIISTYKSN